VFFDSFCPVEFTRDSLSVVRVHPWYLSSIFLSKWSGSSYVPQSRGIPRLRRPLNNVTFSVALVIFFFLPCRSISDIGGISPYSIAAYTPVFYPTSSHLHGSCAPRFDLPKKRFLTLFLPSPEPVSSSLYKCFSLLSLPATDRLSQLPALD